MRAAGGVPDDQVIGDAKGAAAWLRAQPEANGKVGVIGFCSGGRHAFLIACRAPEFDALVDCWGGNVIVDDPKLLNAKRPIAPIELDAQGCSVQMRSNPPQKDDNGRRYYELLIRRGGSIALCRYEKQPGQPRVRVPAVLTHEVVGRLIDDFSATVDSI